MNLLHKMNNMIIVLLTCCCISLSSATPDFEKRIDVNQFHARDIQPYNPPPYQEKAKRARYLLHKCSWGVLSTLSTHYNRTGMPFANVVTVSDGPVDKSTGIPYFYLMDMDVSMQDVMKNSSVAFTITENEVSYCKMHNYNPEWPLCTRVSLSGKLVKITDTADKSFALNALFSRYPEMKDWPAGHGFYPVRLNIEMVWMLDYFGPATIVPLHDYYAADPLK